MTNEEAIELLYDIQTDAVYNVLSSEKEALEMAIKALEQQPCEDCISREATIEAIYKKYIGGKGAIENAPINDLYAEGLAEAVDAVWDMPSVTPTRPTGKWIRGHERHFLDARINVNVEMKKDTGKGYHTYINARCSKCRMITIYNDSILYEYCPHCGARMEESEDNKDGEV